MSFLLFAFRIFENKYRLGLKIQIRVPYLIHGTRHREQCAISNDLDGYGNLWVLSTPSMAGSPLSKANCVGNVMGPLKHWL